MIFPKVPLNEEHRLNALYSYDILDTEPETKFDDLIKIASLATNAPLAMLSIIDDDRQWFKSKVGTDINNIPRSHSFCAHAINESSGYLEISNLLHDKRFRNNPAVQGENSVLFYAGHVIKDKNGYALGTLCVMDIIPRELSTEQRSVLQILTTQATDLIESRKTAKRSFLNNEKFKLILNNINDSIFELDEFGTIIYANSHALQFFPTQSIIDKKFTEILKPEDVRRFSRLFIELIKQKKPVLKGQFEIIRNRRPTISIELIMKLVKNADNLTKVIAVSRDITVHKKYNETLKQLSSVAENTTNLVTILDNELTVKWVNNSFCSLFKVDKSKIQRRKLFNYLSSLNTKNKKLPQYLEKVQGNNKTHFEFSFINENNKKIWLEFLIDPVQNKNKKASTYICIARDITNKKNRLLKIKLQNKNILQSLEYAAKIQTATLPSLTAKGNMDNKSFVIYKPKEIVSGDFYLTERIEHRKNEFTEFFAIADCTGHGIPGAMLSILCNNLLLEALKDKKLISPGNVLDYVKLKLYEYLQFNIKETVYDGMDVSMIAIDKSNKTVYFSGANRPLYIVSEGELNIIKGDLQSVGFSRYRKPFSNKTTPYKKGDRYFMFSDGIVDQFGGPNDKKYMSKRLKGILLKTANYSLNKQKDLILESLEEWQKDKEQTDDICIMAVELH